MKKMTHVFFTAALLSIPVSFLFSEKDNTSLSNNTESSASTHPQDATDEVNAMDNSTLPVTNDEDSKETQVLLNHFAGIVGNFFNIIQDPNNSQVVGSNIANMIGGMINIVVEAIKNDQLNSNPNQKEITRYVEILFDDQPQLKKRLVKLVTAKRVPIN